MESEQLEENKVPYTSDVFDDKKTYFYQKVLRVLGYNPEIQESSLPNEEFCNKIWVPDSKAMACFKCQKQFSLLMRRHHCRICGNVFCKDCSQKMVEGKYWGCQKDIKVCEYCYKMYKKLDETLVDTIIENKINLIENINSIDDNIKNLKRETKLSEYCKKAKKELEEQYKFLVLKDKKTEDNIKQNIESCFDQLVRTNIETILKNDNQNQLLYENWYEKIVDLIKKAIAKLGPSYRDLKDSLNINDFIKIKTIKYKDQSLCKLIDGFAFQKNVASKKMKISFENPKILLLDCGLDSNRYTDQLQGVNFDLLKTQEPVYIENIRKKIELLEVNLILINKGIAHKLQQEFIHNNKISLVVNVKSKSLKQIARCTKTYVLPSIDLIDKQTILGQCKQFRIEKIKVQNPISNPEIIKSNEYNLMTFEGCDNLLFQTLILSGPNINELKSLKSILKYSILLTVRDLYIQKSLLYFSYCDVPKLLKNNDNYNYTNSANNNSSLMQGNILVSCNGNEIGDLSPLISNTSVNRFFFTHPASSSDEQLFKYGFDNQILLDNTSNIFLLKLKMCQGLKKSQENITNGEGIDFNSSSNNNNNNQPIIPLNTNTISEPEVLKKINSICGEPEELKLIYYSRDARFDKPLGKLIIDLCAEKELKCDKCKRLRSYHYYYLYSNCITRIKVQILTNSTESKLDKVLEYINREGSTEFSKYTNNTSMAHEISKMDYSMDIFMYGYCKTCNEIVTPLVKCSRDLFNFSSAKYFKHMLFNTDTKNRSDAKDFNILHYFAKNNCCHPSFSVIERIFVTKIGTIRFSVETLNKYVIDCNLHEFQETLCKLSDLEILHGQEQCSEVLDILKTNMILAGEEYMSLKEMIMDQKINNNTIIIIIEKERKELITILSIIKELSDYISVVFSQRYDNYSRSLVYIKKFFYRICQMKIIYNKTRRTISKLKYYLITELEMNENSLSYTKSNDIDTSNNNITSLQTSYNKYSSLFKNINYIDIDSKSCYLLLYHQISFFDDKHSSFTCIVKENDISSVIAYALTSDKYRLHLHQLNKFKILDLKCERKAKYNSYASDFTFTNRHNYQKKDTNTTIDLVKTDLNTYNYFSLTNQNETALCETSLLFDSSLNYYPNNETTKINQQLETELLSDDKNHFVISITKMTSKGFRLGPRSRKMTLSSSKQNVISNSPLEKNVYEIVDDKLNTIKEEIQKIFENFSMINSEFKDIKTLAYSELKNYKLNFFEDNIKPTEFEVTIYYPRQFEALRISCCASYEELISSIIKSNVWSDVSGGKSKASFFRSLDNKYLFKSVKKNEFKMFIEMACQYFHHNAKFLFHKMPSALAKMLGAFKIKIKTMINHKQQFETTYLILMENLFYGYENDSKFRQAYDLKGSTINRYIHKKFPKSKEVLLDTNFKEDFNGEPIPLDRNIYELLAASVHNDSLILSKSNVIDYSLLLILNDTSDPETMVIRLGIIDYIRKYTWDKQLEHVGKIIINGLNTPTIISPIDYRERFRSAISTYFIGV